MADAVDFVAENFSRWNPEAIELRRCRNRQVPVIDIVQAINRVGHFLLRAFVPRAHDFRGVHAVGEVERGVDVQVVEQRERAADGDLVLHSVAPVLDEVRLEQLVFLRGDGVGEMSRVTHRNFLVPPFFSHHFLAFEGVEARNRDVQVWQRHGDGRVAHILRQIHGR